MENPAIFMFVISCNSCSEIPHFIFKWKWNTELQEEEGRRLLGIFAGSGCAAPLPSHALHWGHQLLLGRAQQLENMDTQVQYWYVCPFIQAEDLVSGLSFWFLSCLAPVFPTFKYECYDNHFSLMYVSFLPSFLFLPLSLPFCFSVWAMCDCKQVSAYND